MTEHISYRNKMVVICAVNNDQTLERDLMSSPMLAEEDVPLFIRRGATSAGEAYNAGIAGTTQEYMIFAHQDVYLPRGWDTQLSKHIQLLEEHDLPWGVIGCAGVTRSGKYVGTVWSSGAAREYKSESDQPAEIRSLDEVVLVVRRSANLCFDSELPHFHLYGTDIVLAAATAGYRSFAINAPVVHNSNQLVGLDSSYKAAFEYMCDKWSKELPIRTPICVLSSNKLSLFRTNLWLTRSDLLRKLRGRSPNRPVPNPSIKAQELGYETLLQNE